MNYEDYSHHRSCLDLPFAWLRLHPGCSCASWASPFGPVKTAATGQLEVFSALHKCRDGNEFDRDPAWYQHTDYTVYDLKGKRVKHVFNSVGHYAEAPRPLTLPVGKYLVKARAHGFLEVDVPVVIEPGRTTRVHLDANWTPPADTPQTEIVSTSSGYPVGWRSNP